MNEVQLVGRVTRPVELRTTREGNSMVRFSLAVQRQKKEDGADFINCIVYGKTAELMAQYVHKGDRLGVMGRIQTGSYEKDGKKVYTTDIIGNRIEFLFEKRNDEPVEVADGDLPF